jgi:ferric iron reductase protein FhuF
MAEPIFLNQGEAAASLSHYFAITLYNEEQPNPSFSYTAEDLITESSLAHIVEQQAAALGQPGLHVTGTLFAKRYSVWVRGALAAWSLFDSPLDLDHSRVGLALADRGIMHYSAKPAFPEQTEDGERERKASTQQYMRSLEKHLIPVVRAVSLYTGANEKVVWSIIGHNVFSLYASLDSLSEFRLSPERLAIAQEDWITLASSAAFLKSARYPLFQHPRWQGPPVYVRKHCCLAHKLDSHGYCDSCPKLTNEERLNLFISSKKASD